MVDWKAVNVVSYLELEEEKTETEKEMANNPAIVKLKERLNVIKEEINLRHKELSLSALGKSFGECEQTIREKLATIWEQYAMAPDSELTADAIVLKNMLLEMVEK